MTSGARPLPGSAFPSATTPGTWSGRGVGVGGGVEGQGSARRPIHPYPPWVVEGARVELEVAGLRKSDNPLILQATARELINNKYKHCICVYTDGSVTTEGVWAALVVPQLSNLTRKYQLPHVYIYSRVSCHSNGVKLL